MSGGL
ncbi:hypothetical protein TIFTF001_044112 [Ficus carica]|jgi:hypothetical protein